MSLDRGQLQAALTSLAREHQVPGAQLVLRHDGTTASLAAGTAHHGVSRPVDVACAFPYASATKLFTATLVMTLASAGDLELDDPITAYLPELRGGAAEYGDGVTLRRLLSHTSGLQSDLEPQGIPPRTLRQLAASCRDISPMFPPGHHFSYSNLGFLLVGRVIEAVTEAPWSDAIDTWVLQPLEMAADRDIGVRYRLGIPGEVSGHTVPPGGGRVTPVAPLYEERSAPAGGLAGSAAGLEALARAHLGVGGAPLLMPAAARMMRVAVAHTDRCGLADNWGLGVARFESSGSTWFGHDGTGMGTTCHVRFEPDSGTILAVTTNAANGTGLWNAILDHLRTEAGIDVGTSTKPPVGSGRRTIPPDLCGDYVNGDLNITITENHDGTAALDVDKEFFELEFHEGMEFSTTSASTNYSQMTGRFVTNEESGDIEFVQLSGRMARRSR